MERLEPCGGDGGSSAQGEAQGMPEAEAKKAQKPAWGPVLEHCNNP